MRSRREPAALLAVILSLSSCSQEHDPGDTDTTSTGTTTGATSEASAAASTGPTGGPVGDYPSLDERPCPEDSILTAENFGAPFMLTHCTGCHHAALKAGERAGAPLGVDFETLTGLSREFVQAVIGALGDLDRGGQAVIH